MGPFRIITQPNCRRCDKAKHILKCKRLPFSEDLRNTPADLASFKAAGYRKFPQIFEGERHLGGLEQLQAYVARHEEFAF